MKRFFALLAAFAILLTACSGYSEPDVSQLMESLLSGQNVKDAVNAPYEDISLIFEFDPEKVEEAALCYSGDGGYADMAAVFKLYSADDASAFSDMLSEYKDTRYEDFKGYAPMEAEKIENGRVLTYGRYVLLLILPDIPGAVGAADAAFSA